MPLSFRNLTWKQLGSEKGIPGSKVKTWRDERAGKFVKRRRFGPKLYVYPEPLVDYYNEAIATGHTDEEATIIAERRFAEALAKSEDAA
jgi:hypothetical protein